MREVLKLFMAFISVGTGLGCVSPFYGTARIQEGFHAEAGVSAMTYIGAPVEYNEPSMAVLGNDALNYGFNPKLQIGTRLGLGYGQSGRLVLSSDEEQVNPWEYYPDVAVNIQTALDSKTVTPGLRIEGSVSQGLSAAMLLGLGNREWLTLGLRGNLHLSGIYSGFDCFFIVRPIPDLSLFAGINPLKSIPTEEFWPVATLGVGYKIK
ncbi:hypothetical protein GF359_07500 [candidate division WOR-3 bacterium]|uniref:Uncharacterized protein n=1 Tax=candidate division WOR-3 bacterium TaxID=2052148 RepID=A0A9D5KAD7_UNCW3|nr:hypothetical protein [candidate division WOR-3 bacterium]MBD3365045.1 hypothetical protein [candidate division WOR-3 bacterium]